MRELTVVASCVRALLDFAVSRGANRPMLLERSMIDPRELSERDSRVAFSKYVAMTRAAAELCQDPAIALHFGERVDLSEISVACTVGGTSTIDNAIAQLNRYTSLGIEVDTAGSGDRFQLKRADGKLWFVDGRRNPNAFPELTEAGFARLVCSMRRRFGNVTFFKKIHVTHPAPEYRAEYERIFQVPIVFDSGENAMQLDKALLAGRWPSSSPYLTSILKDHAETLLQKMESSRSTRDQVETLLMRLLKQGTANMKTVACELGVSRQTLFRRLQSEGVTFEEVLSELRCSLANHYLRDGKVSIKETAYMLGFSDPAAFSRAFKKWTGYSPERHASFKSAGHEFS